MSIEKWKLLKVVYENDYLIVSNVNVWTVEWHKLAFESLEIPHPSYPKQKHMLHPYYIETEAYCDLFMAGELSNNVWCFYVPSKGQPLEVTKGLTVNEKLYSSDLVESFNDAIKHKSIDKANSLLILSGLHSTQAKDTVAAILSDPTRYGY